VLLEVNRLLAEYQENIIVVGGWVPGLLLPQDVVRHVGSLDVDLALNHRKLPEVGYKSIKQLLEEQGYRQGKQSFNFHRNVKIGENEYQVQVDFLAGEYAGTGKRHRTQKVQDLQPRKAPGVDIAFEIPEMVTVRGRLPGGGEDAVEVKIASIGSFIVMKGMALKDRLKEIDSWDIYYCIRFFPDGIDALIQVLQPLAVHGLAQEAFGVIAEKFSSPSAVGPTHVADFEEITDQEERDLIQRDAYERVMYLLEGLGYEDIRLNQ
jgi:hypothetical protein